jgi:hypothetical protein
MCFLSRAVQESIWRWMLLCKKWVESGSRLFWGLTDKTWLLICNPEDSGTLNILFVLGYAVFRMEEYLNRNAEHIHCMCCLAWPTGLLSRLLNEGFTSEFRSLLFFYYTEEPLWFLKYSTFWLVWCNFLCWLSKGENIGKQQQNLCFHLNLAEF